MEEAELVVLNVPSPRHLIQEDYYPDQWKVLVTCLMLNRTRGQQVRPVAVEFFRCWPETSAFLASDVDDARSVLKPLGFWRRREKLLREFTQQFELGGWEHARELKGIGEYAARCWEIMFQEQLGSEPPKDHALLDYWNWASSSNGSWLL